MSRVNRITIVLAILTVVAGLCAVVIFIYPKVFFNVLEPTGEIPRALPSITLTRRVYPSLPPEWTATPSPTTTATKPTATASTTASPTITRTPAPTGTRAPTATGPTRTPRPFVSPTSAPTLTPSPNRTPTAPTASATH